MKVYITFIILLNKSVITIIVITIIVIIIIVIIITVITVIVMKVIIFKSNIQFIIITIAFIALLYRYK